MTKRVNITLSKELLQKLDNVSSAVYASRSAAIRLALVDWFASHPRRAKAANVPYKPPPPPPKPAEQLLTPELVSLLRRYQAGEITFKDLIDAGLTTKQQLALMDIGEL